MANIKDKDIIISGDMIVGGSIVNSELSNALDGYGAASDGYGNPIMLSINMVPLSTTSYQAVAYLAWPGYSNVGHPSEIKAIAESTAGSGCRVRIYDYTNSSDIQEVGDFGGTPVFSAPVTSLESVSSDEAIWRIDFKNLSGGSGRLWTLIIYL